MNKVAKYLIYIVCIITIIQTSTAKKRAILEVGVYGGISYSSSSSSWVTASGDAGYASHSISASNGSETLSAPSQGAISSQEQSTKYNAVV